MVKHLFLALFFGILVLLETSFLVHLSIAGIVPALTFIGFFLVCFFRESFLAAPFLAGFFLDIFSLGFFGQNIIVLILIAIFLKTICASIKEKNIFWFVLLFSVSFVFYKLSANSFPGPIEIICNSVLAILSFFVFKFLNF